MAERKVSADQVIARLRRELAAVPGATLFLQAVQDIRVGGRQPATRSTSTRCRARPSPELYEWTPKITAALQASPTSPTSTATSRTRGWSPTWSSIATLAHGSASR
jgi:multidrug efflux pump